MTIKEKITTVIKFGGSITERGTKQQINQLGEILSKLFFTKRNFIIVPGGGIFAESIRKIQKKLPFTGDTAHWMAIHAIEQHGLLLKEIIPNSIIVNVMKFKPTQVNSLNKIPILSVLDFTYNESKLEHSWNTTSDSIACEIASYLGIKRIIFLKDIDGIIKNRHLISQITCDELKEMNKSPLDPLTPELLKKKNITAFIINGFQVDRVEAILTEKSTISTEILS